MELGNWSIKNQLGSTNSKGLPVLFQGSHQGFLLNNQLIHYDGSHGHAHCHPCTCHQVSSSNTIRYDTKPHLHPHPNSTPTASYVLFLPSTPATSPTILQFIPMPSRLDRQTDALPPSTAQEKQVVILSVGQSDLSIQSQSHIEPYSQERSLSARTDNAISTLVE